MMPWKPVWTKTETTSTAQCCRRKQAGLRLTELIHVGAAPSVTTTTTSATTKSATTSAATSTSTTVVSSSSHTTEATRVIQGTEVTNSHGRGCETIEKRKAE